MKGWTGISELFIVSRKNFKKAKVILNLAECSVTFKDARKATLSSLAIANTAW